MSSSNPKTRPKQGPRPPAPESASMPLASWAKRTGFRPKFTGETNASDCGQISLPQKPREQPNAQRDLEAGRVLATLPQLPPAAMNGAQVPMSPEKNDQMGKKRGDSDGGGVPKKDSGHGAKVQRAVGATEAPRRAARNEEAVDVLPQIWEDDGFVGKHTNMKYELRDSPGLGD